MTLSELMQRVLRVQAQARELEAAITAYDGWSDIPGDNAAYCARSIDSIIFDLDMMRDTLREELKAASGEGIGEGIENER